MPRLARVPPSALPRPGIDADRHLVPVLAVRSPGEVAARVLARELVDPGQGLEELELDDLAPDLEVTIGTARSPTDMATKGLARRFRYLAVSGLTLRKTERPSERNQTRF